MKLSLADIIVCPACKGKLEGVLTPSFFYSPFP